MSRFKVKEFIRRGMPAGIIGCVWYAHAENIDEWFKRMTRKDYSKAPEEVLDSAEWILARLQPMPGAALPSWP